MMIKSITDLGNGMSAVEVIDTQGLISNYIIESGTTMQLMKEIRESM